MLFLDSKWLLKAKGSEIELPCSGIAHQAANARSVVEQAKEAMRVDGGFYCGCCGKNPETHRVCLHHGLHRLLGSTGQTWFSPTLLYQSQFNNTDHTFLYQPLPIPIIVNCAKTVEYLVKNTPWR